MPPVPTGWLAAFLLMLERAYDTPLDLGVPDDWWEMSPPKKAKTRARRK
jgi:hypothetical protein